MKFAIASCERPHDKLTREPVRNPSVVGAILRVGHWLDMSTQVGIDEFAAAYQALIGGGVILPLNKQAHGRDGDRILRRLDRRVFNQIHENRAAANVAPYDAVRGPFPQGHPVAPSSSIHRDTHVQIALRNPACVMGYFAPIEAGEYRDCLKLEFSTA